MKLNNRRLLGLFGGVALTLALVPSSTDKVAAQDPGDDIKTGVLYKCEEDGHEFKVLSCDENDRCQVLYVNKANPRGGSVDKNYKSEIRAMIESYRCKPASASKPPAKPKPTPEVESETEPLPEDKPAPKKKPDAKPAPKPTPEENLEPEKKAEQKPEDDAASAEPAPATAGPQFSIGDCVQVDGGKGVIKRADGDNFYVDINGTSKRVPFSSASKLKKTTGCGN